MRAGDIVLCDFGVPPRGEAGFVRPAVVITSDDVLEFQQHAIVVVPCTSNRRGWITEVDLGDLGVAQAHLPTTISLDRVVNQDASDRRPPNAGQLGSGRSNVGAVALRQIRELIADVLGI